MQTGLTEFGAQACSSCREKKWKCDKGFPTCSSCQRVGGTCYYDTGTVVRNPAPPSEDFEAAPRAIASKQLAPGFTPTDPQLGMPTETPRWPSQLPTLQRQVEMNPGPPIPGFNMPKYPSQLPVTGNRQLLNGRPFGYMSGPQSPAQPRYEPGQSVFEMPKYPSQLPVTGNRPLLGGRPFGYMSGTQGPAQRLYEPGQSLVESPHQVRQPAEWSYYSPPPGNYAQAEASPPPATWGSLSLSPNCDRSSYRATPCVMYDSEVQRIEDVDVANPQTEEERMSQGTEDQQQETPSTIDPRQLWQELASRMEQ